MEPQLTFDGFQLAACRTWNTDMPKTSRICNAAMGLAGEVGEVVEPLKKHLFHAKAAPAGADMAKELGDVLYYVAIMANELGLSLQDIAQGNVDKLRARYPNGFPVKQERTCD